jgi:preprotein translocase subunit YajC
MTFKKGDKIYTEDGHTGEILFIDKDGLEAQVALERISTKFRTDTLRKFEAEDVATAAKPSVAAVSAAKKRRVRRTPTS